MCGTDIQRATIQCPAAMQWRLLTHGILLCDVLRTRTVCYHAISGADTLTTYGMMWLVLAGSGGSVGCGLRRVARQRQRTRHHQPELCARPRGSRHRLGSCARPQTGCPPPALGLWFSAS
eukprot:498092-Rhodomonas_salina.1